MTVENKTPKKEKDVPTLLMILQAIDVMLNILFMML